MTLIKHCKVTLSKLIKNYCRLIALQLVTRPMHNAHTLCAGTRGVERLQCYAFACPPCVDQKLAADCKDYVFSVALRDDVVSRFSPQALAKLHEELRTFDLEPAMEVQPLAAR